MVIHDCIRNRMQINTGKTQIMVFCETPALLRAWGGQHQPGPTMPPFHVYSPFPTSDPRSNPIHEVSQFEYLGLILDPGRAASGGAAALAPEPRRATGVGPESQRIVHRFF